MVVIYTDSTVKSWYNSKEILKEVVIMVFSISEIKESLNGVNFNSVLETKEKLMEHNKDVLDVKGIFVQGTISYDDGLYLLNYALDYTITLPSSRSMLPVDVHQVEEVSEIFIGAVGIHAKGDLVRGNLALIPEGDYVDLEENAINNVLLTIPMQVLSEEEQDSDTMLSGNSWSILTEEQYDALQDKKKKENNPFSALDGLFED